MLLRHLAIGLGAAFGLAVLAIVWAGSWWLAPLGYVAGGVLGTGGSVAASLAAGRGGRRVAGAAARRARRVPAGR